MTNPATKIHEVRIVTPLNLDAAIEAATKDHIQSAQLSLLAIGNMLREIERRDSAHDPLKCLCRDCSFAFAKGRKPVAFAVVIPMFPEVGQQMFAHGICIECLGRDDLLQAVELALCELFPLGIHKTGERLQ